MFRKYVNKLNNLSFYINIGLISYGVANYNHLTDKKKNVKLAFIIQNY